MPSYSSVLISTLAVAFLAGLAMIGTSSMMSETASAEPLSGGMYEMSSGAVLSWEVDAGSRTFFARVHNDTRRLSEVKMQPDELEAIISVTPRDGTDPLLYVHKEYLSRMKVAFWLPPTLELKPNAAHDWSIGFSDLRQVLSGPPMPFDDALSLGKVEIVSVHGANFRYDEEGRFDGFN